MSNARRGMAYSSVVVMAAFVGSKFLGLARDRAIAGAFGAGPETDAYYAALRIPDLLFTLVAGGALVSAFLPVFAEALAEEDRARAWRICGGVTNLALAVTVAMAGLGTWFAQPLIAWLAPGFPVTTQLLSADLMRILLVGTIVFAVSGLQMGILNAFHHFLLPALAPAVYNAGLLFGAVALAPTFGIRGVAYGALIGAVGHLLIKVPGLIHYGYRYVPTFGLGEPGVVKVLRLMGPRVLGLATVQVVWFVTVRLASPLAAGSLAAYQFAWALAQMPQTLLGTAVGVVAFPTMADMAARGQQAALQSTVNTALRSMMAASIPASLALFILAEPAVDIVLVTGAFSSDAATATVGALRMLAIGLMAHVVLELLARAFYALQDTVRPLYFAALAMVLNVLLAKWLVTPLGVAGLALANSIAVTVEIVIAYELLRRRLGGAHTRRLITGLAQIAVASAIMGGWLAAGIAWRPGEAIVTGILDSLPVAVPQSAYIASFVHLGFISFIGGIVYVAAAWALGLDELRQAVRGMAARLTFTRERL